MAVVLDNRSWFLVILISVTCVLAVMEFGELYENTVVGGYRRVSGDYDLYNEREHDYARAMRDSKKKLLKPWMKDNDTQVWINWTRYCGNGFLHIQGKYFREEKDLSKYEKICKSTVELQTPQYGRFPEEGTIYIDFRFRKWSYESTYNAYGFNATGWWWYRQEIRCYDPICRDRNGSVLTNLRHMHNVRRFDTEYLYEKTEDGESITLFELNRTQLRLDNPDIWFLAPAPVPPPRASSNIMRL